jgi:hypothetical protein
MSYSHIDASMANELGLAIDHAGITYFRDVKDINWGDRIDAAVQTALEDSNALLVIISPASLKSLWVPYEIGYFSALKRPILPYLTHPLLDVPSYISNLKHVGTVSEATDHFAAMKDQLQKPRSKTSAPHPDVRIRYSPAMTQNRSGGFTTLVSISAENHDINPVFISSFSLLLDDGRRMQIVRDGITGLPVGAQELRPGQRFDVHITRRDLGTDLKPTDVIGVVAVDQIGRQFHGDPNRIQECIAELFRNDEGK